MIKGNFQYEYFSSVTQRKAEWLWYAYITYGKFTIIKGNLGEGKSTFMLNIAALLTRRKNMPDGYHVSEPQRAVYQTAEDNLADTVKYRLVSVGADCNKIVYIIDEENPLTLEDSRMESISERTIQTVKKELGINSHRKNSVWLWRLPDSADSLSWEIRNV